MRCTVFILLVLNFGVAAKGMSVEDFSYKLKPSDTCTLWLSWDKLNLYPNPAKNSLTVQWKMIDFEKGKLTFFDILGKQVLQQQIESGSIIKVVNLGHLQSGLYFIQVKFDDESPLVRRVIINK